MGSAQLRTTRLAPSPTGALHLGNARTFLVNWALARQQGWQVRLRIEDLDGPRIKPDAARQAIDLLAWLGMDWDGPVTYQSTDMTPYAAALEALDRKGVIYPCRCSRREIEQAQSAPHVADQERRYPGTCRPGEPAPVEPTTSAAMLDTDDATAWRVRVPDEDVLFDDQVHGQQCVNVQQHVGDFVVATKQGLPAYQLAVVVDDTRQQVTDVVRGDDLLGSTARQILLYRLLDEREPPRWWHLPMVIGPDGRRLAKRHGDTRVAAYREQGVSPERVVGLLAWWCGASERPGEMSAADFALRFASDRLSREPITFTQEDDAWLRG